MKSCILPLNPNPSMKGYLLYSFPLCIMQSCEEGCSWVQHRYFDTCSYMNEDDDINMEVLDAVTYGKFYREYGPIQMCFYKAVQEIVPHIRQSLEQGEYVIVFIDEYTRNVVTGHFLHEILIYGYEDEDFLYIAFDYADRFKTMRISQNVLEEAYINGNDIAATSAADWVYNRRVINCKFKALTLSDSIEDVVKRFNKYKQGGINLENATYGEKKTYTMYHGIDNTKLFLEILTKYGNEYSQHMPYAGIHMLCESKQLISERIKSHGLIREHERYNDAVQTYMAARLVALKDTVNDGKSRHKRIYELLEQAMTLELLCLR